jgi:DNA-binding MarR family transcriptional regulator
MPRPKKVSDEEILEAMLDLEKDSPDGTVSLSELARKLGVTKQALSQRLDDRKEGRGLVQRGLVARAGKRFKLTERGRVAAETYRRVKVENMSWYMDKVAEAIFDFFLSNAVDVLETPDTRRKLAICYSIPSFLLAAFLSELWSIIPRAVNERVFEKELKKLWERQVRYAGGITLKDAVKFATESLMFLCGERIDELFTRYVNAILGIGFFELAVETIP